MITAPAAPPVSVTSAAYIAPSHPPTPLEQATRARLRRAAFRACHVYPGPVGEILRRELMVWEQFGYRFGDASLIYDLIDVLLDEPIPTAAATGTAATSTAS